MGREGSQGTQVRLEQSATHGTYLLVPSLRIRRFDRAYFFLILLMCYLNETRPDTWRQLGQTSSYEDFVRQRPVFKTIERELDAAGIDALVPLERPVTDGAASNDEVADFVAQRSGRVLSAFTLLKSDFFSGLQKMSLPERVDGAPNFRRVPLGFSSGTHDGSKSATDATAENGPLVYGTGMPTADGLKKALERMGAKEMTITWTSMREEPVLYVSRLHPCRTSRCCVRLTILLSDVQIRSRPHVRLAATSLP